MKYRAKYSCIISSIVDIEKDEIYTIIWVKEFKIFKIYRIYSEKYRGYIQVTKEDMSNNFISLREEKIDTIFI